MSDSDSDDSLPPTQFTPQIAKDHGRTFFYEAHSDISISVDENNNWTLTLPETDGTTLKETIYKNTFNNVSETGDDLTSSEIFYVVHREFFKQWNLNEKNEKLKEMGEMFYGFYIDQKILEEKENNVSEANIDFKQSYFQKGNGGGGAARTIKSTTVKRTSPTEPPVMLMASPGSHTTVSQIFKGAFSPPRKKSKQMSDGSPETQELFSQSPLQRTPPQENGNSSQRVSVTPGSLILFSSSPKSNGSRSYGVEKPEKINLPQ